MSTQINDSPAVCPTWLLLRDYFAAKALCGYLSGRNTDAMLKAREVKL